MVGWRFSEKSLSKSRLKTPQLPLIVVWAYPQAQTKKVLSLAGSVGILVNPALSLFQDTNYWGLRESFVRLMAPPTGLEPMTHGLTVHCSTNWATGEYWMISKICIWRRCMSKRLLLLCRHQHTDPGGLSPLYSVNTSSIVLSTGFEPMSLPFIGRVFDRLTMRACLSPHVKYSHRLCKHRGGGFSLKCSNEHSINELSPCVPRFSTGYAFTNRIPSFLILIAAFTSLLWCVLQFGQSHCLIDKFLTSEFL